MRGAGMPPGRYHGLIPVVNHGLIPLVQARCATTARGLVAWGEIPGSEAWERYSSPGPPARR